MRKKSVIERVESITICRVARRDPDEPGLPRSGPAKRLERDGVPAAITPDPELGAPQPVGPGYIAMEDVRALWDAWLEGKAPDFGPEALLRGLLEFAHRDPDGFRRSLEQGDAAREED